MTENPVEIYLDLSNARHQISRHLYGHFAEHLGWGIYGGFYVGEDSSIPNNNGLRLDVIEALKKLRIPNLRWPGGCFADTYYWKDGIGPLESRPSIVNTWWGGNTESNHFGTHDFLNLCELLGAEPFISANVGSGTVRDLMDWVQYVNFDGESPMSRLRKDNGRDKPWRVRYWGLGNEAWGCGGNMRAEYYADVYRQYATFMTDWSNSTDIFRVASGPQSDDYHWTEVLMRTVPARLMEGIGLHHYSVIDWNNRGPSVNFTEEQYFRTMSAAFRMQELIRRHGSIMDRFDADKKVALFIDEWGGWYEPQAGTNPGFLYQQNTMRDALITATTLNIFNNHSDRVRLANLAQAVNVLQCVLFVKDEVLVRTPTYHVMEMYTPHHDAISVPVELVSPIYKLMDESLPAISVSASVTEEQGALFITLANIDPARAYSIVIRSAREFGSVLGRILLGMQMNDANTFENPSVVFPRDFIEAQMEGGVVRFDIPSGSIISLQIS